jgi:probable HAF family extracellular repeat protein
MKLRLVVGAISAALLLGAASRACAEFYTVTSLGSTPGLYASDFGINNAGQMVGAYWSAQDNSVNHLVLYSNGKPIDLGSPGPGIIGGGSALTSTAGLSLNNAGQVAGSLDWGTPHAFLYSGGKFSNLGLPSSSTSSAAVGINSAGQVVGWVTPNRYEAYQPFLYSGGKPQTLPFSGVASGINDAGQVVGTRINE